MKLYIKDRKLKNFLFVGWNVTWQSWPSVLCKSFHINPLIPSNVHHKSDFKEQQRWLPTLNILQRGVGHFYLRGPVTLSLHSLHFTLYCVLFNLNFTRLINVDLPPKFYTVSGGLINVSLCTDRKWRLLGRNNYNLSGAKVMNRKQKNCVRNYTEIIQELYGVKFLCRCW